MSDPVGEVDAVGAKVDSTAADLVALLRDYKERTQGIPLIVSPALMARLQEIAPAADLEGLVKSSVVLTGCSAVTVDPDKAGLLPGFRVTAPVIPKIQAYRPEIIGRGGKVRRW